MKLAVFADGTWNKIRENGRDTNVAKLFKATIHDGTTQKTAYEPGVGVNPWEKLRGGLFGMGIDENIKKCYRFLVREWHGDPSPTKHDVYLFGFSRGAYTVRSLGGLLGRLGLVRDERDVDQAYEYYRVSKEDYEKKKAEIEKFQAAKVANKPQIRMIGVWDTVGALGIPLNALNKRFNPFPHEFHDTSLGPRVEAAYHAVAVDERRVAYEPTLWTLKPGSTQTLEQVFFPGAHSDVGGGYDDDWKLADITLEWMARRARARGLALNGTIPECKVDHAYGRIHEPMKYIPIRRAPRKVESRAAVCKAVHHRWNAKECIPFPYLAANLDRKGAYAWVDWPEK
ncbi:MAG TPA: DUF2235 domain-containing protein [Thermoanaerobaculia bacterium]|nr:DUF2235 domain-containing protein [Thermoanaerobaculia bacterium]